MIVHVMWSNIVVVVCKGRGYNFYFLAPCGGRLFNSHMTYDITSCICDVTSSACESQILYKLSEFVY